MDKNYGKLNGVSFAKEWIKAIKYKIEDGSITYKDYIELLKQKISELKGKADY